MIYVQLGTADSRDEFSRRLKLAAEGTVVTIIWALACVSFTQMKVFREKTHLYYVLVVATSTYFSTVEPIVEPPGVTMLSVGHAFIYCL